LRARRGNREFTGAAVFAYFPPPSITTITRMRIGPLACALFLGLAGCASQNREPEFPLAHRNPIIVHEFAFSPGVVALDPTLGYSLYRGSPGVPREQRAEALGRAAAFNLADALSRELSQLGYDVMSGEDGPTAPGERALIVNGDFRHIYEGHRHEGANAEVNIAIDYQLAGQPPQRLTGFVLDSQRLQSEGLVPAAGQHGEDVNYEATRLGAAIGRYVAELAQSNRWPGR
jgi:hypothetical protein